ncbi:hypothetical protein [Pseudomonas sp. GV071]|uniref:hypothetical protein n=1 Tax=Pseudomonas sp. GV071 TaxID=2135754 RepID=UPI000D498914|nr:hypothetical protein [Pseudomonas sp. GV071]PTQ71121.1 hypothetical protein C8K61_105260 [Pseudomonas sp. GV071]
MNKLVSTTTLLLLLGAGTLSTQTQAAPTLLRSYDFINAMGVNLHVSQGSSNYAKMPMVISNMNYLGVVNARDSYNPFWGNPPYSYYTTLAKAGIKWNYIAAVGGTKSPTTIATFLTNISTVENAVPGSTLAVEGPNEINNFALTWQPDGTKGLPAALSFQKELYAQTKANVLFKNAKVFYFTGYNAGGIPKGPDPATTPGLADYNNQHPYPAAGKPPTKYVKRTVLGNTPAGAGPAVYTETGYQSPKTTAQASAAYLLSILANSAYNEIYRTYIYQLMDEGDGYGLFAKADNAPTPAAVAWHNLNTILLDSSPTASSFALTKLIPFSTAGLPPTGRFIAIQKSNYETNIMIWAEPDSFPGPSAPVTVNLGSTQATVNIYDPLIGTEPVQALRNVNAVQVNLTDHPLIIQVPASTTSLKKAKLL